MKVLIKNEGEKPISVQTQEPQGPKEQLVEPNGFAHLTTEAGETITIVEIA